MDKTASGEAQVASSSSVANANEQNSSQSTGETNEDNKDKIGDIDSLSLETKDEYMEDPLPDLVGSLNISENLDPDVTSLDHEFTLEDFELSVSTTDEENNNSSSDSELEFFDVSSSTSHLDTNDFDTDSVPETENVSVELEHGSGAKISSLKPSISSSSGSSGSNLASGASTKFAAVKNTARKVASSVSGVVGKRRSKLGSNIKVSYHNLDKPYMAKVSPSLHYKTFLTLGEGAKNSFIIKLHMLSLFIGPLPL